MSFADVKALLDGIVIAAPFSMSDARELYDAVKHLVPASKVDVNLNGTSVYVTVELGDTTLTRVYAVT